MSRLAAVVMAGFVVVLMACGGVWVLWFGLRCPFAAGCRLRRRLTFKCCICWRQQIIFTKVFFCVFCLVLGWTQDDLHGVCKPLAQAYVILHGGL